jgi:hypothetical protein
MVHSLIMINYDGKQTRGPNRKKEEEEYVEGGGQI